MIIETRFIAENKRERKALQMMHINMQESGMEVCFVNLTELTVKEAQRKRRSRQEIAEAALAAGEAHP